MDVQSQILCTVCEVYIFDDAFDRDSGCVEDSNPNKAALDSRDKGTCAEITNSASGNK